MNKKDLYITLNNIDQKLEKAIDKVIDNLPLTTMNLNLNSTQKKSSCECPIIEIKISDKSRVTCSTTKDFFEEYRELNKNLQSLAFKYMKATNSFIEFEYGAYK